MRVLAAAGVGLSVCGMVGIGTGAVPATPAMAAPPGLAAAAVSAAEWPGWRVSSVLAEVVPPVTALPLSVPAIVGNPRTSWGPTLQTVEAAGAAVAAMSVEQLAGQVLVAQYRGPDPQAAASLVARWNLGGVILMRENILTWDQVRATADAVQAAVAASGRSWPGIVAVDEEGGRVSRLAGLVTPLPAFAAFGGADAEATRARFGLLGADLAALGITMDMAPVADVTIGPADPTIGDRSASSDPLLAAQAVSAASRGLLGAGVIPVLKHFPGHGSVTVDSHEALPFQTATLDQLEVRDLVPFRAGIAAGAPVVMVGHLCLTQLDPGVPASLSAATYRLLREVVGFEGVVVTDSLAMGAIPDLGPGQEAVAALVAGADLVLMPRDVGAAHAAIVAAVGSGVLSRERLIEAAVRVVALQMWFAGG